jgi:hypothetical protein
MSVLDQFVALLHEGGYQETLDTILDDESWTEYDKSRFKYFLKKFRVGNEEYAINFNLFYINSDGITLNHVYDVDFRRIDQNNPKNVDHAISNTGKAFEVFSIVGQMLEKFLTRNDDVTANGIFFTAKEPSRKMLYRRYAKLISEKYSGMYQKIDNFREFPAFRDYKDDELFMFLSNKIVSQYGLE